GSLSGGNPLVEGRGRGRQLVESATCGFGRRVQLLERDQRFERGIHGWVDVITSRARGREREDRSVAGAPGGKVVGPQDSNLGPTGYEPAALTAELGARRGVRRCGGRKRELPAPGCRPCLPSLEERPETTAARRVAQLAQRLGLDLPDALAGDREALADFLER